MAKNSNASAEQKTLIANWTKAQKTLEDAQAVADAARAEVQKYTKAIYEQLGSKPFEVAALGRKYRAIHKPARKSKKDLPIAESWAVLPLPENEATFSF